MNRPAFEALDAQGLPYLRPAMIVAELPSPEARAAALNEACAALAAELGLKAHKAISPSNPLHLAFNMTRAQARNHKHAQLLLISAANLPLDHCPTYR